MTQGLNKKQCTLCKKSKSLDFFNLQPYRKCGYQSRCKQCTSSPTVLAKQKRWRKANPDKQILYYKKKHRTGADNARATVYRAIRKGLLINLKMHEIKCVDCTKHRATEYDHRDYNKPLEVQPVCRSCNGLRGSAKPIKRKEGDNNGKIKTKAKRQTKAKKLLIA